MAVMKIEKGEADLVTPSEKLGDATVLIPVKGAYLFPNGRTIHASLTGLRVLIPPPPNSSDQRSIVDVVGHRSHGPIPEPGSIVVVRWSFHPFVYHSKRFYTVLIWRRVLAFLVASQTLRIITFYSTQLPGPNYHCREGSELARLPRPDNVLEVLLLNFPRGVFYGCGDLIFSSHMIFTLVFVLTYQKYGSKRFIKMLACMGHSRYPKPSYNSFSQALHS